MSDDTDSNLWTLRDDTIQHIQVSALYHRKRERFFDFWDRFSKATTIVVGSAAMLRVVGENSMAWIGAAAVIPTTFALVFGFGEKSRRHGELAARFKGVEAAIARIGDFAFQEADINRWRAEVCEIEATEPRALSALVRICERQIFEQRGQGDLAAPLTRWQRLWAHFWDFQDLPSSPPRSP